MPDRAKHASPNDVSRMLADAMLPVDVRPGSPFAVHAPRSALLTGACGFLGRYVARELLRRNGLRLVCLVREQAGESAEERVARILSSVGVCREDLAARVDVVVGDLTEPKLGLDAERYAQLSRQVDAIYHCAAKVDWVRGYAHLHRMNVGGVLAMIRLACAGPAKRLVFVSSVAACFAWDGPEHVCEDTDMLPFIGGMPLGYARSKCVAESLLRQAGERGVPVTVLRPSLISGDSRTGASNKTDLIAAMIEAAVVTGITIDADWLLDCVPVDFVARVMAEVPQGASNWLALNLRHASPRHWREVALWMNLHGYPVELVDSDTWVRRQFAEQGARGTLLYAQRQFFSGRASREEASPVRPYEAYLAPSQTQIDTSRTHALLAELGIFEAALDSELLHAYFEDYRRSGLLPAVATGTSSGPTLEVLLRGPWSSRGGPLNMRAWGLDERSVMGVDDGLLSEIATARARGGVGLKRLHDDTPDRERDACSPDAVLKAKVSDRLLEELSVRMTGVCRPGLGRLFELHRDALGLQHSQERELALYELAEPRLSCHMPACFGTLRYPEASRWAVLLEYLPEAEDKTGRRWIRADDERMRPLLQGLADIHSVWFRREDELATLPWLALPPSTPRMLEMTPLWRELSDFARTYFEAWCGPRVVELQARFIASLDAWWPRLQALPATLIHNDFNPRNFVLRGKGAMTRLCVFDWELATLGLPQHDFAELLCFTWQADMTEADFHQLLEAYRRILSTASGHTIDVLQWREGFALALRHLLINRLALYTVMHRFRALGYLPRVMRNWMLLHAWAEDSTSATDVSRFVRLGPADAVIAYEGLSRAVD